MPNPNNPTTTGQPSNNFGSQLGMQAAQGAIGGILGIALGGINDQRQRKQQKALNAINFDYYKNTADYNYQKQMDMWNATNYAAQVQHMKSAGLNPAMIYGMSGGGGVTTGSGGGQSGGSQAMAHGGEIQGLIGMGMQNGLMAAQMKLIEAQTEKTKVEAAKTAGVDTDLTKTQIGLMKLDKQFYEQTFDQRIEELNRNIELTTQQARSLDQQTGITSETRSATVFKAQQEALGAVLENLLIGERTRATTQEIDESKARINQMQAQINKWTEEVRQGWAGLSLREKEIKIDGLMNQVEAVTANRPITNIPALSPKQRRQVVHQIDEIVNIGKEDFKK